MEFLSTGFQTLSQIISAGIAILAFSLLIYALTFNLRDRVARSFALILGCIVIVFTGESLGSVAPDLKAAETWLKIQWIGLVFLPPAYLHFSDALLSTTGRPSRGRRRMFIRFTYLISIIFLIFLPLGKLVGSIQLNSEGVIHLQKTMLTVVFIIYYGVGVTWAGINFWRSYRRTLTSTSRRRMRYLVTGGIAPPLAAFPYLVFGSTIAESNSILFWLIASAVNVFLFISIVSMAYAVAFFGVSWPDRVVKSRLAKWLLRGPVTASFALGFTTFTRRTGELLGMPDSLMVPLVMVCSILLFEHLITLFFPVIERWMFGEDQQESRILRNFEERLLTSKDRKQFLENVIAAICDQCQTEKAFIVSIKNKSVNLFVHAGDGFSTHGDSFPNDLLEKVAEGGNGDQKFYWGDYYLIPIYRNIEAEEEDKKQLLGLIGIGDRGRLPWDLEQVSAISALEDRVEFALSDLQLQYEVFESLENLTTRAEVLQTIRAASRYESASMLEDVGEDIEAYVETQHVKDALSHYWGGPKLMDNPLMRLKIVEKVMVEEGGNPANALRSILRKAIERIKPDGERRFTGEWILYNILEMKFMEGRKVREVALRLAMSEADLYRKQRVAIESVAQEILNMENEEIGNLPEGSQVEAIHG